MFSQNVVKEWMSAEKSCAWLNVGNKSSYGPNDQERQVKPTLSHVEIFSVVQQA
jgi:hypothetical protein